MATTYEVYYNINVHAEQAIKSITKFKTVINNLNQSDGMKRLERSINQLNTSFNKLKGHKISLDTKGAENQLQRLITLAREVRTTLNNTTVPGATAKGKKSTASAGATKGKTGHMPLAPKSSTGSASPSAAPIALRGGKSYARQVWPTAPKNIGYKLFGPTPLPSNGGMAVDMLKGMGIAYGIAGIGQLFSNVIQQATEYDNTMKTVENILKSHDQNPDFAGRFAAMSSTIRNVGMETKYTITEVADAAKFLAMAGLDTEAINRSIRPIADIALVGDTGLGETADLVTNIMTAYNISPERMRRAADVMTNTFTMSNTTLTEIAEAYKYSAALLSAGGIDFEESAAAIGVLGDAGIKGSQAGTTLRTIMANIVNPTKKQRKAWQSIGVTTQGKSLVDIFKELNEKNLDVSVFYRLFHKTAAQGAVALADHVQKWNEVIVENFMSDGLSKRLADEKKNTLQGLWAQLKSVFVDDGVSAFNTIQGSIRTFLKDIIAWLKTAKAKEAITGLFKTLKEFGDMLVDVSKTFYWFYETCGNFIMAWMKVQLLIWPVTKSLAAFKNIVLSLSAVKIFALNIRGLAMSWGMLNKAMISSPMMAGGGMGAMMPMLMAQQGAGKISLDTQKQIMRKVYGRDSYFSPIYYGNTPEDKEYQKRYRENRKNLFNKEARRVWWSNAGKMGLGMAGNLVGAGALGYGMYELAREDSNLWDKLTAGAAGIAGISAMAGGPIGWSIAGVFAGLGILTNLAAEGERTQAVVESFAQFSRANRFIDGIMENSTNRTMRSMEYVYNKHNDINGLIERRIELLREQAGLENDPTPTASVSESFGDNYKKLMGLRADNLNMALYNLVSQWSDDGGSPFYQVGDGVYAYRGKYYRNSKGGNKEAMIFDAAATQSLVNDYYPSLLEGINNQATRRLLLGDDVEGIKAYFDQIRKENDPSLNPQWVKPWDMAYAKYQLENPTEDMVKNSWAARTEVWNMLEPKLTLKENALLTFAKNKAAGKLTDSDIYNALVYGYDAGDMGKLLGAGNGYSLTDNGFMNGTFVSDSRQTAQENALTALAAAEKINEALRKIGVDGNPAAASLDNFATTLAILAKAFLGLGDEIKGKFNKDTITIEDIKYQWDSTKGLWVQMLDDTQAVAQHAKDLAEWEMLVNQRSALMPEAEFDPKTGHYKVKQIPPENLPEINRINERQKALKERIVDFNTKHAARSLTPQQVGNYFAYGKNKNRNGELDGEDGGGGGRNNYGGGASSEDYKSKYRSNSAAPKQVIVNIENLMNVDKVDLSNPDNVAVINDLKSQLAQALVDVVHDFDETWHG